MREKDELDLLLDSALSTYADPGPHSGLEERVVAALRGEGGRRVASAPRRWVWAVGIPIAASLLLWIAAGRIKRTTPIPPEQAHEARNSQAPLASGPIAAVSGAKAHPDSDGFTRGLKPPPPSEPVSSATGRLREQSAAFAARLRSCPVTKPGPGGDFSQDETTGTAGARGVVTKAGTGGNSSQSAEGCPPRKPALPRETDVMAMNSGRMTTFPKLDVFPTPQALTPEERALAVVATQTPAPVRNALLAAQTQDDAPVRIAAIHIPPIEPPDEGQP
jgi:hypothetical protein